MISRFSIVWIVMCLGFYIFIQKFTPKALAIKMTPGAEKYNMIGEQRTHRRQNYVDQRGLENEILEKIDDIGLPYDTKLTKPEFTKQLPAFVVDYANMIRNDMILLDNSIETRTRKRGNLNVGKHNTVNLPCSCEYTDVSIDLGEDYFPQYVENKTCDERMCSDYYKCQSNVYELTVLKRRRSLQESQLKLPSDLRHRWMAELKPVIVGCVCTQDYVTNNRI